MAVIFSTGVQS